MYTHDNPLFTMESKNCLQHSCSGHVARKFIRFTWLEADTQPCPIRRTYVVRLCLAVSFPHSLPICPKHRTISHRKMELDSQLIARFYHQRRFVQSARGLRHRVWNLFHLHSLHNLTELLSNMKRIYTPKKQVEAIGVLTLWKFVRSRTVSLRFEQGPCGRKLFQSFGGRRSRSW